MVNRSIVSNVIKTLLTFGLYVLVWMFEITEDINFINDEKKPTGMDVFLLTIFTCGLYSVYWSYYVGKELNKSKNNKKGNLIIYVLLSVFGLNLINCILFQKSLNEISINTK